MCRCPLSITRVTPLLCREILPQISRAQGAGRRDLMSAVVFASAQLRTSPSSLHALSLTHNSEPNISICEPRLVVADIDTASTPAHGPAAAAAPIKLVTLVTNYIYILFCSEEARSRHCSPHQAALVSPSPCISAAHR